MMDITIFAFYTFAKNLIQHYYYYYYKKEKIWAHLIFFTQYPFPSSQQRKRYFPLYTKFISNKNPLLMSYDSSNKERSILALLFFITIRSQDCHYHTITSRGHRITRYSSLSSDHRISAVDVARPEANSRRRCKTSSQYRHYHTITSRRHQTTRYPSLSPDHQIFAVAAARPKGLIQSSRGNTKLRGRGYH